MNQREKHHLPDGRWWVKLDYDTLLLHQENCRPWKYTRGEIEHVIRNIKERSDYYHSEADWVAHLAVYEKGLSLLKLDE